MRLRREVGDFNFELKDGSGTIPKNLFPEQLIGQIVVMGNVLASIIAVNGAKGANTYSLIINNGVEMTLTYTVATGEVIISG